ncbi:MAG: L,D-transpeptidase family protein [Pseudomonadota bacterium]
MKTYRIISHALLYALIAIPLHSQTAHADSDTFDALYRDLSLDPSDGTISPRQSRQKPLQSKRDATRELFLSQRMVGRIEGAITHMRRIASKGGWPVISRKGRRLRVGSSHREVAAIKKQLVISGDLSRRDVGIRTQFDDDLKQAILNYQKRHGLYQNGYVDPRTREMLSIPATKRLQQLRVNLNRLRDTIKRNENSKKYVVVNVPDFSMQAVDNNRIDIASRVIVGRQDRETPTLSVEIRGVNFNPYWHVPQSLVDADLIPQQRKTRDYLQTQNIRAFKSWGGQEVPLRQINWSAPIANQLKYRQEPGPFNALGSVRIHMPNPDIIYLHDTPLKRLFGQSYRAYSAGCIRVQRVEDLARWILKDHPEWPISRINKTFETRERVDAMIANPIPVHLIYLTSWVSKNGQIQYRYDIYKRDGQRGTLPDGQRLAQRQSLRALSP